MAMGLTWKTNVNTILTKWKMDGQHKVMLIQPINKYHTNPHLMMIMIHFLINRMREIDFKLNV